ncbi:MAG: DciA family protein [Aminivibrio sp.]|nr:DUF721 domain-containing protein [Synergistaceae bacterium]
MRNYRKTRSGPEAAAALLASVMPPGAEEKLALPELRRKWEEVAGPLLAKKSYVEDIEKGELFIRADSPSSAKSLSMRGASLAREAARVGGVRVTSVRVAVGKTAPPHRKGPGKASSPVRVRKEDVDAALEEVKDKFSPERQDAARRLASLMALYRTRFRD